MNSRDMCMIDHVKELMEIGLDSFKIEGRAKSAYYAAIVTGAYRHAIDAAAEGRELESVWRDEVEKVSHRHYSTGLWYGQPGQSHEDARYIRDWQGVRHRGGLRRERPCHPVPAQQVRHGGHRGGGRPQLRAGEL